MPDEGLTKAAGPDRLARALRRRRGAVVLCVIAASVAQLTDVPLAMLVGGLADSASGTGAAAGPWAGGTAVLLTLAALVGLRWIAHWATVTWGERLAQSTIAELRLRMLAQLHRVRLGRLSRRDPGRTAVRFAGDAASLRAWIARALIETPADVVLVLGVLAGLLGAHAWLALVAVVPLLACVPVLLAVDPGLRRRTREARSEQSKLTGEVLSGLAHAPAVRRYGLAARVRRAALVRLGRMRSLLVARSRLEATLRATVMAAGSSSLVGVAVTGAWLLSSDQVSAGELLTALWLAALLGGPMNRLALSSLIHGRTDVARDRIEAVFNLPVEPRGGDTGGTRAVDISHDLAPRDRVRLRLNQLVLPLPSGGQTAAIDAVLHGPGVVQVTGPQEACAALAAALLREVRPLAGRVGINGARISRLSRRALREAVWLVDQAGFSAAALSERGRAGWANGPGIAHAPPTIGAPAAGMTREQRLHGGLVEGLVRGTSIVLIDMPDGLPERDVATLHAWLAAQRGGTLWLLLGGEAMSGVRRLTLPMPQAPVSAPPNVSVA